MSSTWCVRLALFVLMICLRGHCREDGGRGEAGAEELLGGAFQEPHRRGHDAGLPRCRSRQGGAPRGDCFRDDVFPYYQFHCLLLGIRCKLYTVITLFSAFWDPSAWIWAVCVSHSAFAPQYHMAISERTRVWK